MNLHAQINYMYVLYYIHDVYMHVVHVVYLYPCDCLVGWSKLAKKEYFFSSQLRRCDKAVT